MFRNLILDYLTAVVSTVLVESPLTEEVLSAQMLSHAVESVHLVSVVLLLQAAKDKVATAIIAKITFFIMITLTCFFKPNNTLLLLLRGRGSNPRLTG